MQPAPLARAGEVDCVDGSVVADAPQVLSVPVRIATHVLLAVVPRNTCVNPEIDGDESKDVSVSLVCEHGP